MKSGTELRVRLEGLAKEIATPPGDVEDATRRGRVRRTRSRVVGAVTVLVVGSLFVGSIAVLSPTDRSGETTVFATDEGLLRTSTTEVGVSVTYRSDWTLLLRSQSADAPPPIPVYQLTNFDPGVIGPDAPAAWLCPFDLSRIPSDGVVLVVSWLGQAAGNPAWPVALPTITSGGTCGEGSYATWDAEGGGFSAYVAIGAEARAEDVRRLEDAFASMTFRPDVPASLLFDDPNPRAVIASGDAFGALWNLVAFTGDPGVSEGLGCIGLYMDFGGGAGCYVGRDGSLEVIDPLFGNEDFVWSSGSSCGSGHDGEISIDGMVTDEAASVELVLLDGRTIVLQIAELPASWDVPYRAFVGAVADVPEGPPFGREGSPDWRVAGEFVFLDATGAELSRAPFAVAVGIC